MTRERALSEHVVAVAREVLKTRGLGLRDTKRLADSIKKLSDFFIANPDAPTPWSEDWAVEAYFAYYLPLNELRVRAIVQEGLDVGFFNGLTDVVDFGAGPATASMALRPLVPSLTRWKMVERSAVPARLLKDVGENDFEFQGSLSPNPIAAPERTLFVASYSLTEGALPKEARKAEALMLIEPSTQDDGRRLLELRRDLLDEGYFAWAPCPHQAACPLLSESKRDWCHDRVHVERPDWLASIEDHLPFRNQTVTMSYVLLRKTAPPQADWSRLVGDKLEEKGKSRQLVCRGPKREFLAWLDRNGAAPEFPRGIRVRLAKEPPPLANELRVGPDDVEPI